MNKILFKSLLLTLVATLWGSSAWAEESSLDPVGVFTWTNAPAITYDASATSWAINQGGVSGGKLGRYAGPYAIVKFDASTMLAEMTLLSAKLEFDITAGAYNSSMNIALMEDASFSPESVTTESFNASAAQFQAGDWSTKNTTTHFSYDVTDKVAASNVLAFAIYTNTGREQTLSNVKLKLQYSSGPVTKFNYSLTAVDANGADLETLASGEEFEGNSVTAFFPYMFYKDNTLYATTQTPYGVTFDKDNTQSRVAYAPASADIVSYLEGEWADSNNDANVAYSDGKSGHAAGNKTQPIATLPAGIYKATIYLAGNGNRSIVIRNTAIADVETNTIISLPIDKNSAAGVYTSDEFTLTEETAIGFSGYTTGTKTNQSADIDYIYIQKTGEYVPPIVYHTLTFGVTPDDAGTVTSEQLNDEGKYEEGTQIALTATANEGYKFKQWINGAVATNVEVLSTENPYTVTMNSDLNVVAQFVKTYTLTVDFDETKGSVTIDPEAEGGVYEENSVVDLHAIAGLNSNCQFAGWVEVNGDGSETPINASAEYQVTMNRDIHLKALFETITYQLSLNYDQAQGTAEVTPANATNTYETGTELTLTATPAEGYEFVNWTRVDQTAEEVLSDQNPYAFVIGSDIAVKANFKAVESVEPSDKQVLYSWESPTGTVIEQGGTIAYVNGDGDRLNYHNSGNYTICLNGKKANIDDTSASANAGKMVITLDKAVSEGDVIEITAYISKNSSTVASPYVVFETGTKIDGPEYGDEANIGLTPAGTPQTYTVTVPAEAAGSKTITLTRSKTGTNLFITKLVITTTSSGETEEILAGDANLNGEVTVSDAVLATSFVLETVQPTEAQFKATDMDKSETIDVSDVMAIVNIILPDDETQAGVRSAEAVDNFITLSGTDISLSNTNAFAAFQMDVTLDDGAQLNGVRMASRASKLNLAYNRIDDNTYRVVGVAYDKQVIDGHNGQLLTLDVTGNSQVAVDNVIFVDTKAKAYAVGMGHTTGISRVSTVAEGTDVYTVGGVKTTKLTKGLNVIRSANGEVRKVYVK